MEHDAKKLYDSTAHNYDKRHDNATMKYMRKKEYYMVRKYAKGKTLDIGCGTGEHLNLVKSVTGLDISYSMLKEAAKKSSASLIQANAESLPIKSGCFDSVLCMFTVLNICDYIAAIKEMSRVLKKDGIAIVSVASRWKERLSLIEKLREEPGGTGTNVRIEGFRLSAVPIGKKLLIEFFEENGFELLEFHGVFKLQKPYWGWYKDFTAMEKLKLKIFDHALPSKAGSMYFAAFKKGHCQLKGH